MIFLWISPDSSSVLGWGLTPESAQAHATSRDPSFARGYFSGLELVHCPAVEQGANPYNALHQLFESATRALPDATKGAREPDAVYVPRAEEVEVPTREENVVPMQKTIDQSGAVLDEAPRPVRARRASKDDDSKESKANEG